MMIHPTLEVFHEKMLDGLEFCRLAYLCFDQIANQPDGDRILRERRGHVKKIIEELLPISRYIQTFYGAGQYISVRWVCGTQSFDAKARATGLMVENGMWPHETTLEITQALHKNEHLMRELLNSKGGGFGMDGIEAGKGKRGVREIKSEPTSYSAFSFIDDMCEIILKAVEAKTSKLEAGVYPNDTTLIVDCSLITVFLADEWDKLIRMVRARLPHTGFARIFLTASSGHFVATL
jgi:hypothetical protein